ncbi:MAG: rhomboid family intramembrane serine protease [Odoribacteraceae bacterium]|jgi:membrane associated rhomboid family serine protease|nr:rhomboid family intramembrane serine protease [Odoribacteraceae bacterium]
METSITILVATVVVSFLCFNHQVLFRAFAFAPILVVHRFEIHRLITHGFVHANWTHLLVNMFTFYSFGIYVEGAFGEMGFATWAFAALYFGGMVAASLYDLIKHGNDPNYCSIGASGAVSAVLFTSIFLNPWSKIYLFAVIPIPGILFGGAYLLYCHLMALGSDDNINHNAHFYGALYGFFFPAFLDRSLLSRFFDLLTS